MSLVSFRLRHGAASAAREIALAGEEFLPKPLRMVLEADGICDLQGVVAVRVSQVSVLYSFCAETFDRCRELNKLAM